MSDTGVEVLETSDISESVSASPSSSLAGVATPFSSAWKVAMVSPFSRILSFNPEVSGLAGFGVNGGGGGSGRFWASVSAFGGAGGSSCEVLRLTSLPSMGPPPPRPLPRKPFLLSPPPVVILRG